MSTVGLDMNQISELTTNPQARTVRAETVEEALEIARRELGVKDVRVLQASRMRRGGVGGFFARELGVELVVAPAEQESFERMLTVGRTYSEPELDREYVTEAALAMIENAVSKGSAVSFDERLERPSWALAEPAAVVNPRSDVDDDLESFFSNSEHSSAAHSSGTHIATTTSGASSEEIIYVGSTEDLAGRFNDSPRVFDQEPSSGSSGLDTMPATTAHDVQELADTPAPTPAVEARGTDAEETRTEEISTAPLGQLASEREATEATSVQFEGGTGESTDAEVGIVEGGIVEDGVTEIPDLTSAPVEMNNVSPESQASAAHGNISEIAEALASIEPVSVMNAEPLITPELRNSELSLIQERLGRELSAALASNSTEKSAAPSADTESSTTSASTTTDASANGINAAELLAAMDATITHAPEPDKAPATPRPRINADAAKWQASRDLRHQVASEAEEARTSLLEVSDTRIESFRSRYMKPASQAPHAPAQSTQSRQMLAALGSVGIPSKVVSAVAAGETLRSALGCIPCAALTMEGVTLVVGHGPLVRQWATGLATAAGLDNSAVVFATTMRRDKGDLCGVEEIEEWRSRNLVAPVVIAIDAHSPGTNEGYIKRMVHAVRADEVRLVIDANDERSANLWAQLAPTASLDVVRTRHARRPGMFLQLGMPIATIDGELATPTTLALALFEHAAK